MRPLISRSLVSMAASLALAATVGAQDVAETALPKPDGTVQDVKDLRAARALADGRLLVIDPRQQKLLRLDFARGASDDVVSQSSQQALSGLWNWPGDSIALLDAPRLRMTILAPDGTPGRSVTVVDSSLLVELPAPPAAAGRGGAAASGPRMRPPLQPRDLAAGRYVFGTGFPAPGQRLAPGQAPPRTPVPILRLSLETSALDTVIQFTPPQQNRPPQVSQATRAVTLSYDVTPLIPGDAWFVYADGTVGVVRGSNYRMDLIGLDGTRTRIDPIPYPKVSVSEADKKRLMETFKREQQERMGQSPQRPPSVDYKDGLPWPAQHPPFNAKGGVLVDPQDRIWLEVRCASTEKATCYDVISRKGERVSRYRLPEHSEIIAVGQGFVYTVNSEKRDKLVVQRHPVK